MKNYISARQASAKMVFPSPCGEMVMKNKLHLPLIIIEVLVSVPLRGNGYEKPHEVETVVIFSFQGAVAPDYAKR
ncbi:hypothetical protein N9414_22838 [Nodularia spumigena CCY9414]|nr:hypothetical protein N9414_22838 [Nodularia spumigena CCY9414]